MTTTKLTVDLSSRDPANLLTQAIALHNLHATLPETDTLNRAVCVGLTSELLRIRTKVLAERAARQAAWGIVVAFAAGLLIGVTL